MAPPDTHQLYQSRSLPSEQEMKDMLDSMYIPDPYHVEELESQKDTEFSVPPSPSGACGVLSHPTNVTCCDNGTPVSCGLAGNPPRLPSWLIGETHPV